MHRIRLSSLSLSFAVLLMMVAFRAEVVIAEWLEKASLKLEWLSNDTTLKRGSTPTVVEWLILGWVVGEYISCHLPNECRQQGQDLGDLRQQ